MYTLHFCTSFLKIITKLMFRIENSNGNLWLFPLHMKFTVYQLRRDCLFGQRSNQVSATLRFIQNVFKIHGHLFHMASLYTHANNYM